MKEPITRAIEASWKIGRKLSRRCGRLNGGAISIDMKHYSCDSWMGVWRAVHVDNCRNHVDNYGLLTIKHMSANIGKRFD